MCCQCIISLRHFPLSLVVGADAEVTNWQWRLSSKESEDLHPSSFIFHLSPSPSFFILHLSPSPSSLPFSFILALFLRLVLPCRNQKRIFGLLVVFGIIASWAGSAEFANYSEKRAHFDKPYFIVYLNNAWNVLILPIFLAFRWTKVKISALCSTENQGTRRDIQVDQNFDISSNPIENLRQILDQEKMSVKKLIFISFLSTFNLVVADYLYFRALSLTSASSGIVIFNLSSIVTYFLSLFFLEETFSLVKVLAVFFSFGGAALVVFSDKFSGGGGNSTLVSIPYLRSDFSGIPTNFPSDIFSPSPSPSPSPTPDPSPYEPQEWVGDLIMAGGAIFWGIYLVSEM